MEFIRAKAQDLSSIATADELATKITEIMADLPTIRDDDTAAYLNVTSYAQTPTQWTADDGRVINGVVTLEACPASLMDSGGTSTALYWVTRFWQRLNGEWWRYTNHTYDVNEAVEEYFRLLNTQDAFTPSAA